MKVNDLILKRKVVNTLQVTDIRIKRINTEGKMRAVDKEKKAIL